MSLISLRQSLLAAGLGLALAAVSLPAPSHAEWVHEGQAREGKWTAGLRAGLAIPTQETLNGFDAGLGPALNLQLQYGLNKFFAVGFMLEWERRGIDTEGSGAKIGTMDTISLLPTLEFRPGRFGSAIPYLSAGIGVNVNTFNEKPGVANTSFANTFAFRLAGGIDYPLTDRFMLNTELAWKRNRGGLEVSNQDAGNFDSSSANLLFGVKYTF